MYKYYGIDPDVAISRLKRGWSLEETLTTPTSTIYPKKKSEIYDHLGNKFESPKDMYKHYGINSKTAKIRFSQGWPLEKVLTTPTGTPNKEIYDHLGKKFETKSEMCKYYGIDIVTLRERLRAGWSLEKALTTKK